LAQDEEWEPRILRLGESAYLRLAKALRTLYTKRATWDFTPRSPFFVACFIVV
jgi:hypothetical protein